MITTNQFTISAIYDGDNYFIQPSHSSIVLDKDGKYSPQEITIINKYKQGANGLNDYSGRIKIETTNDNVNWTTQYASNANETSITYNLPDPSVDKEPYKYRTSFAGNREYVDAIVGGSVVWNQLILNGKPDSPSGWGRSTSNVNFSVTDGALTFTATAQYGGVQTNTKFVNNHKYLFLVDAKAESRVLLYVYLSVVGIRLAATTMTETWATYSSVFTYTGDSANRNIIFQDNNNSDFVAHYIKNVNLFDLTAMFGTEVADYIYNLEQANAGAGVAFFRKLFPNDYYEYDAGELMSVEGVSAHETVGFNQWDEEWELGTISSSTGENKTSANNIRSTNYIFVLPNTNYFVKTNTTINLRYYNADKKFLGTSSASGSNGAFTTPANTHFCRFFVNATYGTTYNHDICINISDQSRNGEYEPYVKHSYPLDSNLTLRGIPKLDDSGNLYYDGDTYESDGTVTRNFKVKTFDGSESWSIFTNGNTINQFYTGTGVVEDLVHSNTEINVICDKYTSILIGHRSDGFGVVYTGSGSICFNIDPNIASTQSAWKEYLASHPITVIYKCTPTTETATPFQNPQIVDNLGTEEYITNSIVPVGHVTEYLENIINIRCSLYEAGGLINLLDQNTIPIINNIDTKVFLIKVVPEYTVYTSATDLPSTAVWTEVKPDSVDATHYLWTRTRSDFSDNSHTYSDAVCDSVISGVISRVDQTEQKITNKVWESDITTKINQYDGSTVANIRNRVSQTEQDISGVTTRVADVESETSDLGTRMSSAESSITQNASNIALKVDKNGVISSINQTPESITIDANKVNLVGNVSFNMFNTALQDEFNDVKNNSIETIVGTQTAATRLWKGTSDTLTELKDGTQIAYWLPYGAKAEDISSVLPSASDRTSGYTNVYLQLTFANNTTSDWIPVYYGGTSRLTSHYGAGSSLRLIYRKDAIINGSKYTGWWAETQYYSNTSYTQHSPVKAGTNGIRGYTLIMQDTDSTWVSLYGDAYKGTGTTKTRYTGGLKLGKILYSSGAGAQTSNSSLDTYYNYKNGVLTSTTWEVYALDLRYSLNCGTTLTANKPIYLVGTINDTDDLFYLDTNWYTQTVPTTEDGKTYILIGTTYNTYGVYLASENTAYQYYLGKFMPLKDVNTLKAHNAADLANLWINESGKKAKQIIDNWATDATSATTTIKGGLIQTHTITANQLATNAIMSSNYEASTVEGSPYSTFGTFLDLTNGNFYTPNFGVKCTDDAGAFINGEIIATAGRIGEDANTAWDIGTFTDYEANDHGSIIGHGDAFIQSGKWMISWDKIDTRWYDNNLKLTYIYDSKDNTYYDYGMSVPIRNTTDTGYISPTVSENFLYIRNHANTIPSAEADWNYIFRVDKDGMIWINGQSLDQKYASITDVGSVYLPKTGGTVTGDLTVNGTLNATATKANQLTHALSINGKSFDGSAAVNVGAIGAAYGGTGQTSLINSANALLNALNTSTVDPTDDTYFIRKDASANIFYKVKFSTLWNYISDKITANANILDSRFVLKSGDTITGSLTVENGITSDVGNFGDVIVSGVGRFTNGLYGDLIGTASEASKVTNNLIIKLNGGTTEGTNQFTYNGSGAKTVNITASSVGAAASSHNHTSADITDKKNNTSSGALGWVSSDNDTMVVTSNTLAYWNGAYQNTSSNIEYVKAGKLGNIVTHKASDFLGASDNAVSASKFNTARTITLTGDVTGSASSDGTNGWSISTTVADNSHSHEVGNITLSNSNKAGALDPITISRVGSAASNKSFGLPANAITIEYSRDGGATWQDYGATDNNKRDLFNETRGFNCYIGKADSKDLNSIDNQLRITIEPLDRYVSFDGVYMWFSSIGNTCVFDLERSTIGAKETFSTVFTGQPIAGWSGNNIRYFSYGSFGGSSSQTSNNYKYRITFKQTAINANYASAAISDIRFFGANVWTSPNKMVSVNHMYTWDRDFNVTFPADVTADAFHGNASSASKLNSTRSFTVGKTAKNVDWSGAVSFTQAEISDNASTTAAGWMSKDDKNKLNGIEAGAQVNTITGVKGSAETSYRTGNVNITAANIGLGNLTNNRQVKGLSSGTTSGHLVTWGADGYTVADSGITKSQLVKSVASDANGKLILTYADDSTSDPIDVEFIATQTSSVSKAEALNVNGTAVGGSEQPVYFDNKGKPQTANKIPKLNNTTTGGTFYAPTGAGTSGQILKSSGGTPTWVNQSTLSVGSATTAGSFSSDASVTLTGDTVGTASSTKGWSISTKTSKMTTVGDNRNDNTLPSDYANKLIFQGLKNNTKINSPSTDNYSYLFGLRGWSDNSGGNSHELAFNNSGIFRRQGATDTWDDWAKLIDSDNYTDYTVKKDGTGATGNWSINAATATKFNSSRSITLTGDVTGSASSDGTNGWNISATVADDSHNHTMDTILPQQSKTFTNVIGTENSWAGATFFYGSIKPSSWNTVWRIKYKIKVYVPDHPDYCQMADVMVSGKQGDFRAYYSLNTIGSYYVCYYHELYRLKQAGFNNGYGHSLGVRFYSAYAPIDTNYKRTIEVEIYETENCTFDFYDSCLPYASISGTGTTNYNTYTEFDFVNNGLQETGDSNDANYYNREYYTSRKTKNALYRYQLCLTDSTGELIPVNSVNNNVATNKTLTTDSFDPFGEIFYWNSTNTYSANTNIGNVNLYRQYLADFRYSFNCGGYDTTSTLTAREPLYLVAVPQSDGTAKLHDSPLTQVLPTTDDGLIYIYLGRVYEDTKPYRVVLTFYHPVYWYKDGTVRPYIQRSETANYANQATKWTTAQKVYVTLGTASTTTTIQGGSTNAQTIGVDGTLGVAHGGTGKTTAKDAANEFMNALDTGSSTPVDADYYISQYVGGGTTTTTYHRRPMSALWNYIKGKSDSTYANITGDTFTGAVSGTSFAASSYMTVNSGNSATAGGLALYGTTPTTYGLAMRTTANQTKHGFVQGDWAIYSFMSGADDRGWIFKNVTTNKGVASISNTGQASFNGEVAIGTSGTNTSNSVSLKYDNDLKCLNFVFN